MSRPLNLRLFWNYAGLSLGECTRRVSRTLELLASRLPESRNFFELGWTKEEALRFPVHPDDAPRVSQIISESAVIGGMGQHIEYLLMFWSGLEDGPSTQFCFEHKRVNYLLLQHLVSLKDAGSTTRLLLDLAEIWDPCWASAYIPTHARFHDPSFQPTVLGEAPHVGWITYFAREQPIGRRLRLLTTNANAAGEGRLLVAADRPPDPDIADDFEVLRRLSRRVGCVVAM